MVVLSALVCRLTPDEAKDLVAQLPLKIGERLRKLPAGPDKTITPGNIEADLINRLGLTPSRARDVQAAAARTLDTHVSPGEMQDVRHQLPKELRTLFTPQFSEI